jgi:AcrR family transcriptional regulator
MTQTSKPTKSKKRSETPKLNRDDWLDAAFNAVAEGGFDNVRVLVIADSLGVTRGSFYWHFTDHPALIAALLTRWRERELALNLRLQSGSSGDPKVDLEQLLEAVLTKADADLRDIRFELALRGLGRRDPALAKMLAEVDQGRLDLFEQRFGQLTGDAQKAKELAALFYLAIAGSFQALGRPLNSPQLRDHLVSVITRYLVHQQAPVAI